jgi:hypothetical protein
LFYREWLKCGEEIGYKLINYLQVVTNLPVLQILGCSSLYSLKGSGTLIFGAALWVTPDFLYQYILWITTLPRYLVENSVNEGCRGWDLEDIAGDSLTQYKFKVYKLVSQCYS